MKLNRIEEAFLDIKTPADFLKKQYEFSLRYMNIIMLIFAVLFSMIGIVLTFVYIQSMWWIGLIFIGVGILTLVWLIIIRAYIKGKMQALSEY